MAVIGWLIGLIPDPLLGLGGDLRRTGSAMVSPFSRFGSMVWPAPQSGGPPSGGGPSPGDVLPRLPWDRVLILMLLHTATFVVCVVLHDADPRANPRTRSQPGTLSLEPDAPGGGGQPGADRRRHAHLRNLTDVPRRSRT